MGVHGLWELLAPVGRRVSVESLGSRKLAIGMCVFVIFEFRVWFCVWMLAFVRCGRWW